MDWFQLLILVVFFLFPLIQQGIEASRRSREPEIMIEDQEDEELNWEEDAREVRTAARERSDDGADAEDWSSGWLDWPSEEVEGEPVRSESPPVERERELVPAPAPAPVPDLEPHLEEAARSLPVEPPPLPMPTRPLPGAIGERAQIAPIDLLEEDPEILAPLELAPAGQPNRNRRGSPLGAALDTRSSLRQAVLLHEVLGPPIALRQPGDRLL